jgi:hypothetical protein
MIRNFDIVSTSEIKEATDNLVSVVSQKNNVVQYPEYYRDNLDGYYYIEDNQGKKILLFDIRNATAWVDYNIGTKYGVSPEDSSYSYVLGLWLMIYWQFYYPEMEKYYDETTKETVLTVMLNGKDYTHTSVWYYELSNWTTDYMLPVNDDIYNLINDFCKEYASRHNDYQYNENDWLEFCYVYNHYGLDHTDKGTDVCLKTVDPIKGLEVKSAYTAVEGKNTANITAARQTNRGTRICFLNMIAILSTMACLKKHGSITLAHIFTLRQARRLT